eukprot:6178099-Pleurochrysis_carterae.AAC.1
MMFSSQRLPYSLQEEREVQEFELTRSIFCGETVNLATIAKMVQWAAIGVRDWQASELWMEMAELKGHGQVCAVGRSVELQHKPAIERARLSAGDDGGVALVHSAAVARARGGGAHLHPHADAARGDGRNEGGGGLHRRGGGGGGDRSGGGGGDGGDGGESGGRVRESSATRDYASAATLRTAAATTVRGSRALQLAKRELLHLSLAFSCSHAAKLRTRFLSFTHSPPSLASSPPSPYNPHVFLLALFPSPLEFRLAPSSSSLSLPPSLALLLLEACLLSPYMNSVCLCVSDRLMGSLAFAGRLADSPYADMCAHAQPIRGCDVCIPVLRAIAWPVEHNTGEGRGWRWVVLAGGLVVGGGGGALQGGRARAARAAADVAARVVCRG